MREWTAGGSIPVIQFGKLAHHSNACGPQTHRRAPLSLVLGGAFLTLDGMILRGYRAVKLYLLRSDYKGAD
jgi:hypothetical protein